MDASVASGKRQVRLYHWRKWSIYTMLEGSFEDITHSSLALNTHEIIPCENYRGWWICLGADWADRLFSRSTLE